jgi:hypothetical protein
MPGAATSAVLAVAFAVLLALPMATARRGSRTANKPAAARTATGDGAGAGGLVLAALWVTELLARAKAAGVPSAAMDAAVDSDRPREALLQLLLASPGLTRPQPSPPPPPPPPPPSPPPPDSAGHTAGRPLDARLLAEDPRLDYAPSFMSTGEVAELTALLPAAGSQWMPSSTPGLQLKYLRPDDLRGHPLMRTLEGRLRARSQIVALYHRIFFIPDSLRDSVPLFLKRQCGRTLGRRQLDGRALR